MDKELLERIAAVSPKFNPSIADGLAVEHMMHVNPETGVNNTMAYIDRLFHINKDLFVEGLVYEGSSICSPIKHFEEITKEYNSKRIANIAKSDTYMVKYQFSFKGEPLFPRYILLPFVRDGGLITLNGATYNIAPVLTDVGYSVLQGSIFIPFRRTKLTFNRVDHHFFANGQLTRVYVIWSTIHNEMNKRTTSDYLNRKHIHSCLAHYFFCKFGVTETFKQFANAEVQIGWRREFPEQAFPKKDYVLYESGVLRKKHPTGALCLLVPKEHDSDFVRSLVGGFFYVVDTFPDRFRDLEDTHISAWVDDTKHWQLLLGNLVYGDWEHAGKLAENIETHMESFDNSLDEITREDLRSRGVHVSNIWDLLHAILTKLSHHFYTSSSDEASMYNKRLMVLRYVMEELNDAISKFAFTFQSRRDKVWTANDINECLKRSFKPNTCIKKLTSEHGELDTVAYPGSNKALKLTSILVPQDRARRTLGYGKALISDASRLLHVSISEVGQYNNQPKNIPDGRGRVNLYVRTEVDGTVLRNPEREELTENTQKRFNR